MARFIFLAVLAKLWQRRKIFLWSLVLRRAMRINNPRVVRFNFAAILSSPWYSSQCSPYPGMEFSIKFWRRLPAACGCRQNQMLGTPKRNLPSSVILSVMLAAFLAVSTTSMPYHRRSVTSWRNATTIPAAEPHVHTHPCAARRIVAP